MISILRAEPQDADVLTQIAIAAKRHWKYPETWMQIWIPLLTVTPEYIHEHETWMAVAEENPAAYYSLNRDEDALWLDNLWVSPSRMGLGIGKLLFQHALERGRTYGVSIMKIEADPHAESFYERMGAQKVSERHTEIEGKPRVLPIMEIKL